MAGPILSAGVVVVRRRDAGWRFLLLRAFRYWDFPKGEIEPGEGPLEAAVREVAEETTLTDLRFRWGHGYYETERYGRGKAARYYLAESATGDVRLPVNEMLGRPEHHEARWCDADEAQRLVNARVGGALAWALRRIGASPSQWHK